MHLQTDNPVEERFWGKVPLAAATAFFYFRKGSVFQELLYALKYKGNRKIGVILGNLIGTDLKESPFYDGIDYVVPVPLHDKRLKERGYNQSQCIAEGIAQMMNIPLETSVLYRKVENPSQTSKSVYERWKNVNGIFDLKDELFFKGKHVLLVDDVLTTGSTIEACACALLKAPDIKISVVALAMA